MLGKSGGEGATFQGEPEQQKTKSEKGMEYLWKGDMFHVSEALLISVRIRKYIQCFLMNSWPAYFFSTFCLKIIFKLRPFRSKTPQKIKFKQELPMLILIPFLTVLLYISL